MIQSNEKSFVIDSLNTNNAIYCDSLTLIIFAEKLHRRCLTEF